MPFSLDCYNFQPCLINDLPACQAVQNIKTAKLKNVQAYNVTVQNASRRVRKLKSKLRKAKKAKKSKKAKKIARKLRKAQRKLRHLKTNLKGKGIKSSFRA